MKRRATLIASTLTAVLAAGMLASPAAAAPSPGWGGSNLAPVIEHTGTGPTGYEVTFRLFDPVADRIQITGEWLFSSAATATLDRTTQEGRTPSEWRPGDIPLDLGGRWAVDDMTEGPGGVWTFTTPLPSGTFSYSYIRNCDDDAGQGCTRFSDPSNRPWNIEGSVQPQSQVYLPSDPAFGSVDLSVQAPAAPEATGNLTTVNYPSPGSTDPVGSHFAAVYLPAGYDSTRATPYPTLYLSHGGGGNEIEWSTSGAAGRILDNLLAAGEIQPTVIVATDFYGLQDTAGSAGYAADLRENLIPFIETNLNVQKDAAGRALAGLSLGSFRTQYVMENDPTLFGAYGAWSGGPFVAPAWTPEQIAAMKAVPGGIDISYGLQDSLAGPNTVVQAQAFADAGIPITSFTAPGGHTWQFWRDALTNYVQNNAFRTTSVTVAVSDDGGLTASVTALTPNEQAPTGRIDLHQGTPGEATLIGGGEIAADGTTSIDVGDLQGPVDVTAVYSGDALYNGSTSRTVVELPEITVVDVALTLTGTKKDGRVVVTGTAVNNGNTAVVLSLRTPFGDVRAGSLADGASRTLSIDTYLPRIPSGRVTMIATAPDGTSKEYEVRFAGAR